MRTPASTPTSAPIALTAACLASLLSHAATAQSLVGAAFANGSTASGLHIIDPDTGTNTLYMAFPVTAGYELYYLTSLPICGGLRGGLYLYNNTSNTPSFFAKFDTQAATVSYTPFGPPLNTSYSEAVEYSPRHNALLVSFTSLGNFGTNRLALVSPADGSVISTTAALSGIADMDHLASSATQDFLIDLNAGSASARLKRMVNILPSPSFVSAGSYPLIADFLDFALHPTTGRLVFTDQGGTRIREVATDSFPILSTLQNGLRVQGLTFANLHPRINNAESSGICSAGTAVATATPVGTPPITAVWQIEQPTGSGQYADLTTSPYANLATGLSFSFTDPALDTLSLSNVTLGTAPQIRLRRSATNTCGSFAATVDLKPCQADFNCDGFVDDFDFAVFAQAYDLFSVPPATQAADFNADGFVDDFDFTLFAAAYDNFQCP